MQSAFWDYILKLHESGISVVDPSGKAGLEAVYSIRDIFGADCDPDPRHPLRPKLSISSEPSYQWLIHFVRKLRELSRISGHEPVLARLRQSTTFPSASSEMEFALKLKLNGHPCKFVPLKSEPTADVIVELKNQEVDVELTSLNLPYEDEMGIQALSLVTMIAIQAGCVAGGLWSRVPRLKELDEVRKIALSRVSEAKTEHKMVELNVPGLLMCYIAPSDLSSEIPKMWLGSFVMRTKSQTPMKDRLAHAIEEKVKTQLSGSNPAVLVVYDRFSTPESTEQMFSEKEIELVVGAFRNLAGVILVSPFNSWDQLPPKRADKNGRSFVEYSLPDGECERCVIWKNIMVDHQSVIEPIIDCLIDSPRNLSTLFE